MAQTSLWEALTASVASMDNQAVLAVQSLLESQNITENASATSPVEEDDLFQCGKCKKTYTYLPNFITHKQKCTGPAAATRVAAQQISTNGNSAFTSNVQVINRQVPTFNTVPASPLTQTIGQGMVLTDDLMTLTNIDPTIQTSTLQVGTSIQGNPFLTQLAPLTPRAPTSTTTTVYSTATTPTFSSNQSAFTALGGQIQIQTASPGGQEQQVIIAQAAPATTTTVAETKNEEQIPDPSPIKMDSTNLLHCPKRRPKIVEGIEDHPVMVVKKKLKCQYCEKAFTKNFDLQQHIRSHTGEKPFQCIVCGRAFAQKSNVKKHMQTHKVWPSGTSNTLPKQSGPTLVVEEEMEEPKPTITELPTETIHINSETVSPQKLTKASVQIVVDSSYLCQYCNEKFKSYFALKSHMVQHKDEQVYKCVMKTCAITFRELDDFLEHVKSHETDMSYRCHMCNKQFPSLYELGVHQYSHSLYPNQGPRPGPKYYRCTKCLNKYATPEALEHHMQTTTHNYPCPHCEKIFPCERYLRRHLPIHGDAMDFKCETCGKEFKTDHSLKMHVIIHSGQKPFKCDRCQAAFNRKDKLKRHLLIHDPVRKYKCPFRNHTGCMKEFNRPDKLKAHIISHSGIKPHQCSQCNKSFMRKVQLQEHETQHHTHEFKFKCTKCNKGFTKEKLFGEHKCDGRTPVDVYNNINNIKKGESTLIKPGSRRKVGRPKKRNNVESPEMTKEQITLTVMRQKSRRRRVQLQQESLKDHIKNEKPTVDVTSGELPYKVTPVEVIRDASGIVASEVGRTTTEYAPVSNSEQKLPNQLPGIHTIADIAQLQNAAALPMHTVVLNSSDAATGFATVTITDIHGRSHEASVALADYNPQGEHTAMTTEFTADPSTDANAAAIFNASLVSNGSAANLSNIPNQTIIASVSSNGTLVVHNSAAELLQNTQQQHVGTEPSDAPQYAATSNPDVYHAAQAEGVYQADQEVTYTESVQSDAVFHVSQSNAYQNPQNDAIYHTSESTYVTPQSADAAVYQATQNGVTYQTALPTVVYDTEPSEVTFESKIEPGYSDNQSEVTYPSSQTEAELEESPAK